MAVAAPAATMLAAAMPTAVALAGAVLAGAVLAGAVLAGAVLAGVPTVAAVPMVRPALVVTDAAGRPAATRAAALGGTGAPDLRQFAGATDAVATMLAARVPAEGRTGHRARPPQATARLVRLLAGASEDTAPRPLTAAVTTRGPAPALGAAVSEEATGTVTEAQAGTSGAIRAAIPTARDVIAIRAVRGVIGSPAVGDVIVNSVVHGATSSSVIRVAAR
jgi:hypothetical protein